MVLGIQRFGRVGERNPQPLEIPFPQCDLRIDFLASSARAWLGGRDWYRDNEFEIEARAVEADVREGRRPGPRSGG